MRVLTAFLVLVFALLQYRLWFGDGNVLEFHRLNDRIEELRREGDKRRERNAALEAEVMDLKQGLDAIEERARQDLGMIKEGEQFVQVIDPHRDEPPPAPAPVLKTEAAKHEASKPVRRKPRRVLVPAKPSHPAPEAPQPEPEPSPPVDENEP
jgi:cell division protein FtsB